MQRASAKTPRRGLSFAAVPDVGPLEDGGGGWLWWDDWGWGGGGIDWGSVGSTLNWWGSLDQTGGGYEPTPYEDCSEGRCVPGGPIVTTTAGYNEGWNWWDSLQDWWRSLGRDDYGRDPIPDTGPQLPGYCPRGYYHPLDDPFACVPFPPDDPRNRQAQNQQSSQRNTAQRATAKPPQQAPCPQGYNYDAKNRQCCPPGLIYDPQLRQCRPLRPGEKPPSSAFPWWWLLLGIAGVALISRK
jgi:hypothetical protein